MSKSGLSKGMRRHIRKEKAGKFKKEDLKTSRKIKEIARKKAREEKAKFDSLPNFQSIPTVTKDIRLGLDKCPKCNRYLIGRDERSIVIETKQGKKTIRLCGMCNSQFKIPEDNLNEK